MKREDDNDVDGYASSVATEDGGHVSVNASKRDDASAGLQVADMGLFSLLGPSRMRCASGSVPQAISDRSKRARS